MVWQTALVGLAIGIIVVFVLLRRSNGD